MLHIPKSLPLSRACMSSSSVRASSDVDVAARPPRSSFASRRQRRRRVVASSSSKSSNSLLLRGKKTTAMRFSGRAAALATPDDDDDDDVLLPYEKCSRLLLSTASSPTRGGVAMPRHPTQNVRDVVAIALEEDVADVGDVSSLSTIPEDARARATLRTTTRARMMRTRAPTARRPRAPGWRRRCRNCSR